MRFVTRDEWGARDARQTTNITTPFSMFFVHHTVTPRCFTLEDCSAEVRAIQDLHMDNNGEN